MPIEPGTPRNKQWMQEVCELVQNKMPDNYTFAVFAFPISGSDRIFYASKAHRADVIHALKTWIEYAEAGGEFGKHQK